VQGATVEVILIYSTFVVQIAVTALLGVCSFVLQARISKAADVTQREVELQQAKHEKDRERASLQLDKYAQQSFAA
jgi:hypothetical protein